MCMTVILKDKERGLYEKIHIKAFVRNIGYAYALGYGFVQY